MSNRDPYSDLLIVGFGRGGFRTTSTQEVLFLVFFPALLFSVGIQLFHLLEFVRSLVWQMADEKH